VARECGGSFGNFSGDESFSNGGFCRITMNGGFFLEYQVSGLDFFIILQR
jgi:hypothetical protein